ncbi:hypothetical protein Tco_0485572 [Tanacetum coccineum]
MHILKDPSFFLTNKTGAPQGVAPGIKSIWNSTWQTGGRPGCISYTKNVANIPSFVPKAASVPAGSRNRPTSVPAGRPFSAGWKNHAARPMTRPTSHYFQHFSRPGYYNQMYMDEGRWGTAVKPSAGCSWRIQRPNMQWGSKNNGGSLLTANSILNGYTAR